MIEILFQLQSPPEWFKHINKIVPSVLKGHKMELKEEIGEGYFLFLEIQDGLWAQQLNFECTIDIKLLRTASPTNNLFLIDFYLSSSEIITRSEGQTYHLGFENINLLLTSSMSASTLQIPANNHYRIFNIVFTRDWLLKNVLIDHPHARPFFENNEAIYLSEYLDYKLKDLLNNTDLKENTRLASMVNTLEIIDYLFERVKKRKLSTNSDIHPEDLQHLMRVQKFLDNNINHDISLDALSKLAGMSLSKFKRLFKQVYGNSPYQYHLANKMEKAMEILQLNTYNISETGFLLGYSNISKFTQAFKNHFGILPSEIKKAV